MKLKAITLGFSDAPAGTESVKVTRRQYSPTAGVFGTSYNQGVTLVNGAAEVTFTGLDGAYSFFASWIDGSGFATPIGSAVIPAGL